jgi:hypothetical protein
MLSCQHTIYHRELTIIKTETTSRGDITRAGDVKNIVRLEGEFIFARETGGGHGVELKVIVVGRDGCRVDLMGGGRCGGERKKVQRRR